MTTYYERLQVAQFPETEQPEPKVTDTSSSMFYVTIRVLGTTDYPKAGTLALTPFGQIIAFKEKNDDKGIWQAWDASEHPDMQIPTSVEGAYYYPRSEELFKIPFDCHGDLKSVSDKKEYMCSGFPCFGKSVKKHKKQLNSFIYGVIEATNDEYLDTFKFDKYGYDVNGFDRNDRDRDGYNRAGYDLDGYNRKGRNSAGYDSKGLKKPKKTKK